MNRLEKNNSIKNRKRKRHNIDVYLYKNNFMFI
jgi:hypothetical protein